MATADNKTLYICFEAIRESVGGASYLLFAVNSKLLLSDRVPKPELKKVATFEGDHVPVFMGCGSVGGKIFLVGGIEPATEEEKEVRGWGYGSESVAEVFAMESESDSESCEKSFRLISNCKAGKVDPSVFEVEGKLYVMDGRMSGPFEVFDPETNIWSELASPPFFHFLSPGPCISTLVWGSRIFVSCCYGPVFSYHVKKNAWSKSKLFVGRPFPFMGMSAIVSHSDPDPDPHQAVLICFIGGILTAYLVADEEVVKTQVLYQVPEVPGEHDSYRTLTHLGDGKVCLVTCVEDYPSIPCNEDEGSLAIILTFQVEWLNRWMESADSDGESDSCSGVAWEFVKFEILSKYVYYCNPLYHGTHHILGNIACFAM